MATLSETIWVRDRTELDTTVANLVARGGVVQAHHGEAADVFMKKKINIWVLIGGFLLCVLPGLAYLIWYLTADQDQQIRVQVGKPDRLGVPASSHWFDGEAGGSAPTAAEAAPGTGPSADTADTAGNEAGGDTGREPADS